MDVSHPAGGGVQFSPGQYATLGVEHDGKRMERPYSIASSPFEDEMEFFFELVPEGALTPRLHKLQPGDGLLMRKVPKGKFTLDTQNGRKRSSADLDRDRCGSVCQLCADAIERLEGRPVRRQPQTVIC